MVKNYFTTEAQRDREIQSRLLVEQPFELCNLDAIGFLYAGVTSTAQGKKVGAGREGKQKLGAMVESGGGGCRRQPPSAGGKASAPPVSKIHQRLNTVRIADLGLPAAIS